MGLAESDRLVDGLLHLYRLLAGAGIRNREVAMDTLKDPVLMDMEMDARLGGIFNILAEATGADIHAHALSALIVRRGLMEPKFELPEPLRRKNRK